MIVRRLMIVSWLVAVLAANCGLQSAVAVAQEDVAQEETESTGDQAPASQADDGDAKQAFEDIFAQWKEVLKELYDLQREYRDAEEEQIASIRQRWNDATTRGEAMLPNLREAATKAYLADPNVNLALTRFLVSMLHELVHRDDYDKAFELAEVLVGNDCGVKEVYNDAGIAAFVLNDFEKAETYLKEAESTSSLDENGQKFLDSLDEYKEYWATESKLREAEATADDLPRVKLSTSQGDVTIELFENEAPDTVGNFVSLVEDGFYDGLGFHRVLGNFMAQGGCPTGDGTGGPGYEIYCELDGDDYRRHFRGSLSMAHAGRDTGGSQFFLTFVPTTHLNGQHTVFGRVVEGMDLLPKLQRRDPGASDAPDPDKIIKAEVLRKRQHDYNANKVQ